MLGVLVITTTMLLPLPQAWREAQHQVAQRYPEHRGKILAMKAPSLGFRSGIFHDDAFDKDVYGSCVLGRTPEVLVGVVADPAINRDTLVHEYKHSILFRLPLSDRGLARATRWVDANTSPLGGQASGRASRTREAVLTGSLPGTRVTPTRRSAWF